MEHFTTNSLIQDFFYLGIYIGYSMLEAGIICVYDRLILMLMIGLCTFYRFL